jgi:hypothetical protein
LFGDLKLIKNKWPERRLVMRAIKQYVVESFIVFPLAGHFLLVPLLQRRAAHEVPAWATILWQLFVIFMMTDFIL